MNRNKRRVLWGWHTGGYMVFRRRGGAIIGWSEGFCSFFDNYSFIFHGVFVTFIWTIQRHFTWTLRRKPVYYWLVDCFLSISDLVYLRYQPCDSHVDLPSFRLCPVFVIWASCHLRRLPCRSMLCIFKLCVGLATAGHPSVHSCSSPKKFTLSSFVRGLTDGCLAVKIRLLLLHCMLFFH